MENHNFNSGVPKGEHKLKLLNVIASLNTIQIQPQENQKSQDKNTNN
jgi:hypothetical protein